MNLYEVNIHYVISSICCSVCYGRSFSTTFTVSTHRKIPFREKIACWQEITAPSTRGVNIATHCAVFLRGEEYYWTIAQKILGSTMLYASSPNSSNAFSTSHYRSMRSIRRAYQSYYDGVTSEKLVRNNSYHSLMENECTDREESNYCCRLFQINVISILNCEICRLQKRLKGRLQEFLRLRLDLMPM